MRLRPRVPLSLRLRPRLPLRLRLGFAAALPVPMLATTLVAVPAASAAGYSMRSVSLDVKVGPGRDQPCRVVADLYEPAGTGRAPAVLTTNGFGGSKDDLAGTAKAFVRQGYVVLAYSGLGAGGSTCRITLDHPDYDGVAARHLVSFLAGKVASSDGTRVTSVRLDGPGDPRVGMIGGSYGGGAQFAAAGMDGRIDALVPIDTWHDLRYSLAPNNELASSGRLASAGPGATKLLGGLGFFALGAYRGVSEAQADPSRLMGCPNFPTALCQAVAESLIFGTPRSNSLAYLRAASVASYVSRIKAPTLLVQGQTDTLFNLQEAAETYRDLKAQGTPVKMIWHSGGHSGPNAAGDLDLENPTANYVGRRALAWFAHYLKGSSTGAGPAFAYFRPWVSYDGDATPAYASTPVRSQRLYLSGKDRLVSSKSKVVSGRASYSNPLGAWPTSFSELSLFQDALNDIPPADAPGTFAAWTSTPLTQNLDVVGSPTLSVRLTSPAAAWSQTRGVDGRLVLFAKLYDVAPDGTATLARRLVSPVRVTDVRKPVTVALPGIVHRFRAGHRLRVVVASSDLNYLGNRAVLPVTVRTNPKTPGTLALPVG
ncbi:CocE/NonD family hydrolase [Actinomadura geliboluensis]|uniref:CocE/NonD family hydrolase n=2 Tax=Actinomadura geliboluensis TaxID=882440 RepID=A0A5S4H7Q3_9ACTN|nr:CocE/NonD family hydrolase [Actinomadura geliboluensis]